MRASAGVEGSTNPDSLRWNLLDRINFHPVYDTSYSVNRTSRVWNNDLSFTRKIGVLSLSHSMSLRNNQDKAQNGLRGKTGSMTSSLDYETNSLGGWTFGLDSRINRSSQSSTVSGQADDKGDFGLKGETKIFNSAMQRALPMLRKFTLSTSSEAGYSSERSASRRSNSLDSTRVGGIFQSYNLGLSGAIRSLNVRTSYQSDRRLGDSHTRQFSRVQGQWNRVNEAKNTSNNRSRNLDGNLDWTPSQTFKGSANAHTHHEINQYWDALVRNAEGGTGAAESKDGKDSGGGALLDWNPNPNASLHGEISRQNLMADFAVQPRDFTKRSTDSKLEGRVKLPSLVGPLAGTELHSTYSSDNTRNELEETGNYRQKQRTLRTEVKRSFFGKVQITGTNEVSLFQYFYDDRQNDRDELRQLVDGVLLYTPSALWTGIFSATWSERSAVNIPAAKSSNNNTTQSYRVAGEVDYKIGPKSLSQKYSINADYTFYDFDEDKNSLVRSNDVLTDFSQTIFTNLAIGLQHHYRFRDSGQYIRSSGKRVYIPSSKETQHQMTLWTSYPIGDILRIEARQMLDRRRNKILSNNKITTTTRGEFSLKANIQKDFGSDFHVSASFAKTESLTERNYWTVNAEVRRSF